jgi:hypothetical protein
LVYNCRAKDHISSSQVSLCRVGHGDQRGAHRDGDQENQQAEAGKQREFPAFDVARSDADPDAVSSRNAW